MTDGWTTRAIVARGLAAAATRPALRQLLEHLGGDRQWGRPRTVTRDSPAPGPKFGDVLIARSSVFYGRKTT
jgi:hypothetical protein